MVRVDCGGEIHVRKVSDLNGHNVVRNVFRNENNGAATCAKPWCCTGPDTILPNYDGDS